jgi:PPOX class probable F420-dependent enzyme
MTQPRTPVHPEPVHPEPVHLDPVHLEPVHRSSVHPAPGHLAPGHLAPGHLAPGHLAPGHLARVALAEHRYVLLRTFRRDGTGVDTPLWFAFVGDDLVARSATASAKVRRIAANPEVELRPCDWRGRARDGAAWSGRAAVLDRAAGVAAERSLRERYGWQWNIVPMIPVPGVTNGHGDLGLRERIDHARARELWEASSIIRVEVGAAAPAT